MDTKDAIKSATQKVRAKHEPEIIIDSNQSRTGNDLVSTFFRMNPDQLNDKTQDKLAEIYEYAVELAESDDEMDIVNVLRDMRFKMGSRDWGQKKVDQFHKYVRLRNQAKNLQAKARAMEE